MTTEFWITTAAIVIGPIVAVTLAQWLQVRAARRERKLFVLRALMSTRRAQLSQERVAALNLIDIEFWDQKRVTQAFRELSAIYNDRARWQNADLDVRKALLEDLDDKSVRLVHEIARSLGHKYDQMDILRGGYYPEAFGIIEEQQAVIRDFLVGLRQGRLLLPVGVVDYRIAPPPPNAGDGER
jgi:hypothetical protein